MAFLVVAVVAVGSLLGVQGVQDKTLYPEAAGRVVVEALVDRIRANCIYGDDRLFLRRLAFVETSDGEDPKTYRPGYHGGIWQIDEDKFNIINCSMSWLKPKCDLIMSSFGIDWTQVKWSDLRRPLYSGLAASLFVQDLLIATPSYLLYQAYVWAWYMRAGGDTNHFIAKAEQLPKSDCSSKIDLAFLLDGSGSVNWNDFQHMLTFVQNVVRELDIDEKMVQVSALEFSTEIGTTVTFDSYSTKTKLLSGIAAITKGGLGTNTHLALEQLTSSLFHSSAGARPDAKKVAILLTDGAAYYPNKTQTAAKGVRDEGITLISVGVGDADQTELHGIATKPSCTHVYTLANFDEIDALLYNIMESSCSAPTALAPVGKNTATSRPISEDKTVTEVFVAQPPCETGSGSGSATGDNSELKPAVKAEVTCGSLEIFLSYDTPRPGPAYNEIHVTTTPDHPSIIYMESSHEGRPLYITVVASRDVSSDDITSCIDASYSIVVANVEVKAEVVCRVGHEIRKCTLDDLRFSEFSDEICDDSEISNPCTFGHVSKHEHPYDMTKFIQCDVRGKMYITQCPDEETFDLNAEMCGSEAVGGNHGNQLPSHVENPCTQENIANGLFYFPYEDDDTKYIQCDAFGAGWVKPCPTGLTWSEDATTCTHPAPPSPCAGKASGFVVAHQIAQKYIMCDNGAEVERDCPPGTVFDSMNGNCGHPIQTR